MDEMTYEELADEHAVALERIRVLEAALRNSEKYGPHQVKTWNEIDEAGLLTRREECLPTCPKCSARRALGEAT